MLLKAVRSWFTPQSTTSVLFVNNIRECFLLEDTCRELVPGTWTPEMKVPEQTAIPYGRYRVILDYSERFGMVMPRLVNVPDFEGVRIHWGNTSKNTDGCPLTGQTRDTDWVGNSRAAYGALFRKLQAGNENGKIWMDITKGSL